MAGRHRIHRPSWLTIFCHMSIIVSLSERGRSRFLSRVTERTEQNERWRSKPNEAFQESSIVREWHAYVASDSRHVSPNKSPTRTFSAFAIFSKLLTDGFLSPRSIPARYERSKYAASANRSCDHPFASRNSRIRLPSALTTADSDGNPNHGIEGNGVSVDYKQQRHFGR
jgi:hypothetical protein